MQMHGLAALGSVIIEVGATSGAGNAQLNSTKSYVYNFGVTSQGAGLSINQISIAAGRNGSNNSDRSLRPPTTSATVFCDWGAPGS